MRTGPQKIRLDQVADVIAEKFKGKEQITCYIGSNAASPTASLEFITDAIKTNSPKLPFLNMVHILMQGPIPYIEEGLQDRVMTYSIFSGGEVRKAANEGRAFYVPCTLANIDSLIGKYREYEPDVALFKVRQHDLTGEFSLGLSVEAMHTAIDHADLVIAELDPSMPFTQGQSIVDATSIDYLIVDERVKPIYEIPSPDFENLSPAERRIGELITKHFIRDGATIQVGIGKIPDAVIATICDAQFKDLGIQTELYGDGLMKLQKAEIVTNRLKKVNKGYSTTSLIMGSKELYEYVHMRAGVQMRPCGFTNAAETIRQNSPFISVNTAIGVDFYGNVWADFIDARHYYSGVGGQPDFIRALNDPIYGVPIIAIKSVTRHGESKIVRTHPPGVSLTASAYDGVVIVNEFGIADLRGLTAGEKALGIASIAHPKFRDDFMKEIVDDPYFTKPKGYQVGKPHRSVTYYDGDVKLEDD
ncbi:MAG: acetyl-CoA hydrolase/transferase family protein [Calditrichaeota bacterium]|nr:acetyl-CoA hydrolase/transferase family protein [Calditrichota bacterium]